MFSSLPSIDIGVITAWAGAIGNIPPGWALCDGTNGTPDLRDKFLMSTGPNFSVGDEGGSDDHDHDFTGDGHAHSLEAGTNLTSTVGFPIVGLVAFQKAATGTTDNSANLPKYYALAYIQYLGT